MVQQQYLYVGAVAYQTEPDAPKKKLSLARLQKQLEVVRHSEPQHLHHPFMSGRQLGELRNVDQRVRAWYLLQQGVVVPPKNAWLL